jgi:hypothetical protein
VYYLTRTIKDMKFEEGNQAAKDRRVLANISHYPEPKEIYESINNTKFSYKDNPYKPNQKALLIARDKAFVALLFLGQLRISEAERLTVEQFKEAKLQSMKLSKAERFSKKTGKRIVRKHLYRPEIFIPTKGEAGKLGSLIENYLTFLAPKDRLFNFKNARAEQIIKNVLGIPPHWLRAYGENYLYELFDNDIIAVANYVQVDPGTLSKYIHRTPEKYLKKLR